MLARRKLSFDKLRLVLEIHRAVVSLSQPDLLSSNFEFLHNLVLARKGHL